MSITLGGTSYTLGWNWGAKRRLRERLASQGADLKNADALAENLPAVLWASLDKETRSSLSVEDVEEMIHPGNEQEVIEKIGSLFKASEPEPDPNAQPAAVKKPTAGNLTSRESGQLASTT